jgi:uncharacterized protein YqgV (UPF0045/DUF77 family)
MTMITAEFSILAEVEGQRQGDLVRVALEPIQRRGFRYEVEPLGTTVEGELADVLAAIQEAHELVAARGASRLLTTIRIEDKRGGTSIADKLEGFREAALATHPALDD